MVEEASASASESAAVDQPLLIDPDQPASAICSLGVTGQLVTGYLVDHLRRHYQGELNIEEPDLRELIWQFAASTGILISSIWDWNPSSTETRPAILVKRNTYQNYRAGIGDRRQGLIGDEQGNPHFETFWIGSHTVFCIGGTGAQAELLAAETARELVELNPVITGALPLIKFHVKEIGSPSELEEATENFVVPITIAIAYKESWVVRLVAPVLQGVTIASLLDNC